MVLRLQSALSYTTVYSPLSQETNQYSSARPRGRNTQGEVVPASEKDPEGWSASDKFTVVLETAGLNATELSAYCRERGLYPEQVERWRQAATDANEKPVLTLKEQKELERLRAQDQREIKRLKKELTRKDKALAEAAALLLVTKKMQALWGEVEEGRTERCAD